MQMASSKSHRQCLRRFKSCRSRFFSSFIPFFERRATSFQFQRFTIRLSKRKGIFFVVPIIIRAEMETVATSEILGRTMLARQEFSSPQGREGTREEAFCRDRSRRLPAVSPRPAHIFRTTSPPNSHRFKVRPERRLGALARRRGTGSRRVRRASPARPRSRSRFSCLSRDESFIHEPAIASSGD